MTRCDFSNLSLRCLRLVLFIVVCINCAESFAYTSPRILVKPEAVVEKSRVDMASLFGTTLPERLREPLSKIWLGNINNPLGEMVLQKNDLEKRLGIFAEYFEIPQKIRIRRNGDILSLDTLKSEIERIVLEGEKEQAEGKICIDFTTVRSNLVLPGKLKTWKLNKISSNQLGTILLELTADTAVGPFERVFQIETYRLIEAAKVKKLIKKGSRITSADIEKKSVKIKTQSTQLPLSYDKVLGCTAGLYKSPGSLVRGSDVICAAEPFLREYSAAVISGKSEKSKKTGKPVVTKKSLKSGEAVSALPDESDQPLELFDTEIQKNLQMSESQEGGLQSSEEVAEDAGMEVSENSEAKVSNLQQKQRNKEQWVIKPGQEVAFNVKKGNLSITVPARALEGGAIGDSIRLVNTKNQRQIQGKISSGELVEHAD
ncbi:MAG: flagella basal body P-ring formation protein FlgA [Candidatus Riflebacteria bacterium]|nr:flagella basal body P-ring formation protein FlgA [Candidatus Riflebacteria bacterium]